MTEMDLATFPPVMRISIRTYEPGGKEREARMSIDVLGWRTARTPDMYLAQIKALLEEAAVAAEKAHHAARMARAKAIVP